MGQGRPDGQWQGPTMKDSFNLVNLGCNALGACVTPFLRTGFGKNYPGVAGAGRSSSCCFMPASGTCRRC